MPFADKWIPTIMGPRRLIPNQGQFVTLDLQNHTMKFFLVVPKFTKKMVNFTLQTCLSCASNANTPRYQQVEKLSLCRNLWFGHRAQTRGRCAVAHSETCRLRVASYSNAPSLASSQSFASSRILMSIHLEPLLPVLWSLDLEGGLQ